MNYSQRQFQPKEEPMRWGNRPGRWI